ETLRYDDPLASFHPEKGYAFLKEAKNAIKSIKNAGLTADEFEKIIGHNALALKKLDPEIDRVFASRISKHTATEARALLSRFSQDRAQEAPAPVPYFGLLSDAVLQSLERAVEEAEESGETAPMTAWKGKHVKKNAEGKYVLKASIGLPKMRSLAYVYRTYGEKMYALGYYDFEDMLLEVIQAMQQHPELQHELWEQYQYVMVDEFQDTNDAQMRLIYLLTEAEVMEGQPNVCAVGDDDQAIYKFQGALLSNILDFRKRYRHPKLVVLTENYRSTQDILDLAQFFIRKGEERLEKLIPELEKTLVASNRNLGKGDIVSRIFPTDVEEYSWVAKEIRRLIDEGEEPRNIAVITRKHQQLQEFSRHLSALSIPTYYERNQNVFDQPHVRQLVQMGRFVASLMRKNTDEADQLLPEILSYPFWDLPRQTMWDIAVRAERQKAERQKWMDIMLSHPEEKVRNIAEFFLEAAAFSRHHTLLETLDFLIGEHTSFQEGSDDKTSDEERKKKKNSGKITSPFKQYYFRPEKFEENKMEYLTFLSALEVFVSSIREYRHGERLSLDDLVSFVDRHEDFKIRVVDSSPFVASENAVTLLTAHKAKGLEFGTVFILSCQEDLWTGKGEVKKISFPENLPIDPAGETADDHLRLFFVAVTRAKERLYMTSYEKRSSGKLSVRLRFFSTEDEEAADGLGTISASLEKIYGFLEDKNMKETENESLASARQALSDSWKASHAGPYVPDEKAMLRKILENYQMSPTHLDNFLSVPNGGPKYFLEQSLLHFPQAKNPNLCYGTAMHAAIERLYKYLRFEGKLPTEKMFLEYFENELLQQRLNETDFQKYLTRGKEALKKYFEQKSGLFHPEDKIETPFKNEGVIVGTAHLTGRIDKMTMAGGEVTVVDYKTGKVAKSWNGKGEPEQQKLFRYQNQLLFYKILVEHSQTYRMYKVKIGVLEFLEPNEDGFVELSRELLDTDAAELSELISIVYEKIMNLDFPDTSHYSPDMKGILAFKEDLLCGKV
ncbi:MAG TPA: ATP-dependent DNA helicase, partial [Candidatus Paceibacterota bacterium]|nr:ATP-dependent DNA helicase [Candidatus Paceibacterota bacterium]